MTEEPGREQLGGAEQPMAADARAGRHAASSPVAGEAPPGDVPEGDGRAADGADRADGANRTDSTEVVIGPGLLDDVPPELLPDPRAIARASLVAGRNASLWWVCGGVAAVVLLAIFVSAWAAATTMALLLAAGAVARVLAPSAGPVAFTVRSRTVDVAVLTLLAVGVGVLAQLIPEG